MAAYPDKWLPFFLALPDADKQGPTLEQVEEIVVKVFGKSSEAIDAVRRNASLPMLKPNEAMVEEAVATAMPIVVLATFAPSIPSMEVDFREAIGPGGRMPELIGVHVPDAQRLLGEGDAAAHDRLIAEGLTPIPRWGEPEDVGRVVATLACGDLPFVTGDAVNVDGGLHIHRF